MERKLEKSVKQWLGVFIAIVSYYIIHEGTHLLLALILSKNFCRYMRIQIVTEIISGLSSIVTISIGYILAFHPSIYKIKNKNILIAIYYITLCFLYLTLIYVNIIKVYWWWRRLKWNYNRS